MQRGRWLAGRGVIAVLYAATRPDPVAVQAVRVERGAVTETVVNTRAGALSLKLLKANMLIR